VSTPQRPLPLRRDAASQEGRRSSPAGILPRPRALAGLAFPTVEAPLASFVDLRSGVRVEVHRPSSAPVRWRSYLEGAEARYRSHGVLPALDRPTLEDGSAVSLVFVAVAPDDRVVGGIRVHGPLRDTSEAFALAELAGHPRLCEVDALVSERIYDGLVEVKGAWVAADAAAPGLSDALARCHVHAMAWFGVRWAMCTCADTIAPRWSSSGGRPDGELAPVPYPDRRFRTILLWWDRLSLARRATPEQWASTVAEAEQLGLGAFVQTAPPDGVGAGVPFGANAVPGTGSTHRVPGECAADVVGEPGGTGDIEDWRVEVLDVGTPAAAARLEQLRADPAVLVIDRLGQQLAGLAAVRPPIDVTTADERWVYYPWRRTVVRLLDPEYFRALRLDRNRNKITRDEQERLLRQRVGVVGLSVGHTVAHIMAMEGLCGRLQLADFDTIELSNLNRIPGTVLDLGVNKAVAVARRIAELDPYLELEVLTEGLSEANVDAFVAGVDVVVEECDSLDVKLLVREAARRRRVPVVMETSDRGLFDVERFDLEPQRPLFHGLLGDVGSGQLVGLSTHGKVPHVLRLLEPDQLSSRMAASMAEIDETLTTWPQLGGDIALGAATVAAAVRRIGRGEPLSSGRVRVDLDATLDQVSSPTASQDLAIDPAPSVEARPDDPASAVAHAANLAPSGGNVQPWTLRLVGSALEVSLDRSRSSTMDLHHRGSYVAIGAGLLNARIAAAAHGTLGPLVLFPDGQDPDLVGRLRLGSDTDATLASWYPAVLARCTNRRPGTPTPLDPEVVAELHRHVAAGGGALHLVTGTDALADYAEALAESDRLRYLSPQLHRELMGELRWPGRDPLTTGVDVRTLDLDDGDLAKLAVARRSDVMADLAAWGGGRALGSVTRDRLRSASALAVVTVADTRPASYVAGGMAVQRLWLTATVAGLAVQPVSPLCVFASAPSDFAALVPEPYVERLRGVDARLRAVAGLSPGEVIALVVRLSHADPPSARSLRLPLEEVLRAS
jgi:hypothetical protein